MGGVMRRQDVLGGLLLIAFGAAGLVFGGSLEMGNAQRMGAGYFPIILSGVLLGLGVLVAGMGLAKAGPDATRCVWRPLLLVTAAVMAFSVLIDRAGLIVATTTVVALGALAGRDGRAGEVAVLAVGMAGFAAFLFAYLLGLPLPLFGR